MVKYGLLVGLATALLVIPVGARADSIDGTWKTIDDETKQAKALVLITTDVNGETSGKVTKLLLKPYAICEKCEGEKKDQAIEGMTILWGLKKQGENSWGDGKILDPKSGKVYSARAKLIEDGKRLDVRGYVGFSLLGRSQVWERQ